MSAQQQQFIQNLIETGEKLSLEDFFKKIHKKFYSDYDISFMEYFLGLTAHEGEFVVHHEKLIEYGIMSSLQSTHIREKLNTLGLVENEEYLLTDIRVKFPSGLKYKKVYLLTPEAFKTCLLRARKYPNQKVDPVVYSKYYLLLEKTYKLFKDYETGLLNKQLEHQTIQLKQKNQLITQKDQQLEQQSQQLTEERDYRLSLENSFLHDNAPLEKTQIIYIATSYAYAKQNRFKVGGTSNKEGLEGRLGTYNTGRAVGDDMFFTEWYSVCNFKDVEKRLETLVGKFRDKKTKEIYIMHYTNLKYVIECIVNHYGDETDEINSKLEEFIKNLDIRTLRPANVQPKHLHRFQFQIDGTQDVVIETDSKMEFRKKVEEYVQTMDKETRSVRAKDVLDKLEVKRGRRLIYPILIEVLSRLLPNAKLEYRSSR
jgi:hypothetical protein